MTSTPSHLDGGGVLSRYRHIVVYSRVILCWHLALAIMTAAFYLSDVDLSHLAYWRRSAGARLALMTAPALLPYVISYISARTIQTTRFILVAIYLSVLTFGCGIVLALLLGVFGDPGRGAVIAVLVIQAYIYYWAGRVTAGR
jgi:hypothetical protein